MPTTHWELDLRDDLFGLRHPEDGSEFTASVFYVVATGPDGRRYAHERRFDSAHVVVTDDYMGIASYRSEALAKAERLYERILSAQRAGLWEGPTNVHWHEIDPVYGSSAYVQAEPALVARERAES
jgi:hypothetical protein